MTWLLTLAWTKKTVPSPLGTPPRPSEANTAILGDGASWCPDLNGLLNPADLESSLDEQFERRKFTRRNDLSNAVRLAIATNALHAQMNSLWGTITDLANKHSISRTFVYELASTLKEAAQFLFGEKTELSPFTSMRETSIQTILSLRLEGGSSLNAISTIMNRLKLDFSSVGFISEMLSRIGGLLPMTISPENDTTQYLVFASDEIFSKTIPILVTVDPCSSTILRIELADSRKADDWKKHFECLYDNGVEALYLVTDEGKGLCAGRAEAMNDVIRQSDTYHAIAHQLGSWIVRLEDAAYKAIAEEEKCDKKLGSAKSEQMLEKQLAAYEQAAKRAEEAIMLYDFFSYLYRCILFELNVFDRNGNLRNRQQAEEAIKTGLALIEGLKHDKIIKAVGKIKRTLPNLLHYFDVAKKVVAECKTLPINDESLKAYCIAWQWGKAVRKAKKTDRKKWAKEQERFCLEIAESLHGEESGDIQKEVYSKLDKIVQSSAMVECINSIIRPYLNTTKNHVTQELLNLIMYYHNHRRYREGVRKGKTPMEILTGKEQTKDWISALFDIIREKDPKLLLTS